MNVAITQKRIIIAAVIAGGILMIASMGWLVLRPLLNFGIDPTTAPKFVTANIVDLTHYGGVSKFRSAVGQDFSDSGETCRSMKHTFMPKDATPFDTTKAPVTIDPAHTLPVFSPVDGQITRIDTDKPGVQIYIAPRGNESFTVRLFHVYPLSTIQAGAVVTAGERIGSVLSNQQIGVAVQAMTLAGAQFISYFNVTNDQVLALYKDRGADGAEDFIIPREVRDANPLTCKGEEFTEKDTLNADHWYFFSDFTPPIYQESTDG